MDLINKKIRLLFWISLAPSVGFPLGILGIVFGANKGLTPLLATGIVATVAGFYVMPLLWVRYAERRQDRTLLRCVLNDNIYTVKDLAVYTGYTEQTVRDKLKRMILKRELTGYFLVDDVLEINTNVKQATRPSRTKKCENCGAMMGFDGVKFVCEYCGGVARERSKREKFKNFLDKWRRSVYN